MSAPHLASSASSLRSVRRSLLVLGPALLLAACGGGGDAPAPAAEGGGAASSASAPASAPAASGLAAGKWSGEATGGYKGNRISFVVSPDGSRVSDVTFEGHWDCSDGIEMTTSGPSGEFPLSGNRIQITSVEPEGGGATATRFVMDGTVEGGRASGTLRINLNALGCDTRQLSWTAAPAAS